MSRPLRWQRLRARRQVAPWFGREIGLELRFEAIVVDAAPASVVAEVVGAVDVAGTVTASASASGSIVGAVDVVGSVGGSAPALGSVAGSVAVAGSVTASAAASGSVVGQVDVAGSSTASALASGAVVGAVAVVGSVTASAPAVGSVAGQVDVAGSVAATASAAVAQIVGTVEIRSGPRGRFAVVAPDGRVLEVAAELRARGVPSVAAVWVVNSEARRATVGAETRRRAA